ncbi:hypothetical protein FTO74_03230 [Granulicella sp. WH15]|uniref:hypothetical protein n=1 Tax=Granulicella sp. WH15 TaxID=2602070 RepID=UPI00136702C8|nr:hypothetical protein [Granulicella sp. WH15]QHN02496.1 hypothetical protein FTO74_03230 [Granulicella sp. WH15]
MAQGWESKSVEGQQAEATQAKAAAAEKAAAKVVAENNIVADANRRRKVQELELQRERILSERTSNVHRRTALTNALADIEEKLAELGWTLHL